MSRIILFGEKDYIYRMETVVRDFLKKNVRHGYFRSYDNARIHYYAIKHEDEKGVIVISHGFCEFFYKYHEMSYYFYELGYSVYFIDHRGHGYSQRMTSDTSKVYIQSYKQYVDDLKCFMDKIVTRCSTSDNYILFAHSMGGAIGAMFLEMYPQYFKRAVLSSPLMKMKFKNLPYGIIYVVIKLAVLFGLEKEYAPGQYAFDGINIFEKSSSMSRKRYNYMFEARKCHRSFQTYGGTYAWTKASVMATRYIIRHAKNVKIPVLLCQAGCDSLVDSKGQNIFSKKSQNTTLKRFTYSKHEIFNATGSIRKRYYKEVFSFIKQ